MKKLNAITLAGFALCGVLLGMKALDLAEAGITLLLMVWGGWEAAAAVKAAPWVLAAVGSGLIFSIAVMLADSKHYEHAAQKQQQTTVKTSNERKAG